MRNKALLLIVAGLIAIAVGAWLKFSAGGPARADAALVEKCRIEMDRRGADAGLRERCGETAFAHAMTATDATSAATAISAANQQEVGGGMLAMFMIGLGAVLTLGGLITLRRKR